MNQHLSVATALPADPGALLVGRVQVEGVGAVPVSVTHDGVHDLSHLAPTCSDLLELHDLPSLLRNHPGPLLGATAEILANSSCDGCNPSLPWPFTPAHLRLA